MTRSYSMARQLPAPVRHIDPAVVSLGFTAFHFEQGPDELVPVEALFEFRRLSMMALVRRPEARWMRRRMDGARRQLWAATIKAMR